MRFRILFISLIFIFASPVFAQEWGLVLAGGGGKGAYQLGVWKALEEFGLDKKITVISGTSVGGLNAALFSSVPTEEAENIWVNQVPHFLQTDQDLISQSGLEYIMNALPLEKIDRSHFPLVYVTAIRSRLKVLKWIDSNVLGSGIGSHAYRFCLNDCSLQKKKSCLLATSAVPVVCDSVWIDDGDGGHYYSDGGQESLGGDNVPIDPLTWHNRLSNVIVVYCSDKNHARRIKVKDYDNLNIIEIFPSIDTDGDSWLEGVLDGTTNFSANRIRLLIKTGYEDAVDILTKRGFSRVSNYWFD